MKPQLCISNVKGAGHAVRSAVTSATGSNNLIASDLGNGLKLALAIAIDHVDLGFRLIRRAPVRRR